ncbi:MAG: hypothetical protein ABL857_03815 [Rickettsiales bacterium]
MMNKKRVGFAIFWILIGAIYLAYSGRAEGFVSVRSILVFFIIALIGTAFWDLIAIIKSFCKKDYARSKAELKFLAAKFLAIGLIIGGHRIDNHRITETMNTGNSLIEAVEQYKMKEGHYPASLDVPQFQNYKPSLKDSVFSISKDNQSEFSVSFDSVTFMICTRKNTQPDWYCDD